MPFKNALFLFCFFFVSNSFSQNLKPQSREKKIYTAQRISETPVIDGVLDDEVWKDLPIATDFIMVEPGDGEPSPSTHPTEVKIAYTDEAIYVAAYLFDNNPKTIRREFAQRDNIPVADIFVIDINTYNDGENQTRFVITAAGTLADAKMKGEREDYGYDVVWDGKVSIGENGWFAELKIPYSALRFPESAEQLWGIQLGRQIRHLNATYVWNYIDKSVGKATLYNGLLKGIRGVDPPVRLSLYPYVSGEVDRFDGNTSTSFSAGMDLKYGISDAFTLDATLIPDFGQTAYDEVELNLGPFEQTFNENRAFFTEGTELFTKGRLFYSRRIGDRPTGFNTVQDQLLADEEIVENPQETNLLNALKISGRTEGGLGIGFFNAITEKTKARVKNIRTGETREIVTEPFANYNIFVLDQQFESNSSISIINTNVTREGHFRDANVTGFLFDLYNDANSYNLEGEAKMSNVNFPGSNLTGFASNLSFERIKGNWRYEVTHDFANESYNINDLGLNFRNNYSNFFANTSYRIFEPQGIFNEYRVELYGNHQRRYKPDVTVGSGVGVGFFGVTRDRFAFGGSLEYDSDFKDFFEPRRDGYFVRYGQNVSFDPWVSSDYRKTFAYDIRTGFRKHLDSDRFGYRVRISPRFRFSNKFSLVYSFNYDFTDNRDGFVDIISNNSIVFGKRDTKSIENSIRGSYNFNTNQALRLSFRNFWSTASYEEDAFTRLLKNGNLVPISYAYNEEDDPNTNFNIWNLDLSYNWRFAPGSEAILLYRNSVFNQDNLSDLDYIRSLENLFEQPLRQNISLRIVYYLDYNVLREAIKS